MVRSGRLRCCYRVNMMDQLLRVDYPTLVSRADLNYHAPVAAAVAGQPIGNGVMGTLVWTTPGAVAMQINRCDVLAVDKNHSGSREDATDYCGGCGGVTVDVGGRPFRGGPHFRQHLSLYRAECTVHGEGVTVRCLVHAAADLLVVEVEDTRNEPQPIRLTLSMWRDPVSKTAGHTASHGFQVRSQTVFLEQQFVEHDYYCASVAALRASGAETRMVESEDAAPVIEIAPGRGRKLVLLATAASWNAHRDLGGTAERVLRQAAGRTYEELATEHRRWWERFWSRTFVQLRSDDGVAEFMASVRTLQLYYLASTSRGKLPPKWNGSLFSVDGDARSWGSQFWVWTTEISYYPLHAADAGELSRPFFDMYVKQIPDARAAARQRWNAGGAFFLEAGPFDGPVVLSEDTAGEYQDVYLGEKPNSELSPEACARGLFECGLSQLADGRQPPHIDAGRFSYCSHIASSGSEIAVHAWWRYRYSGDAEWLATHAYPLLRETVEFYRHLARRDEDGSYHLYGLNQHEGYWGVNDGITDLAAIRGTAPLAIRAAEILDTDRELRLKWQELLDNLAPYPMGRDPDAVGKAADDIWAVGHRGASSHVQPDPAEGLMWPVFPFEDWTLETRDPRTDEIVRKFAAGNSTRVSLLTGEPWGDAIYGSATRTPIVGSRTGRGADLPLILASYYHHMSRAGSDGRRLPNGLSVFEGPTAQSIEHLGAISMALNEALLQSVSPRPGDPEVIAVFPAWPKTWDACFRLLARGGFLVSSAIRNGRVTFVDVESRRGEPCRLRNPWGLPVDVTGDAGSDRMDGDVCSFETRPGGHYRILPRGGAQPAPEVISAAPRSTIPAYSVVLPDGTVAHGALGIESRTPATT